MSKLNIFYYIKKYRFNSVFLKNLIAIILCITIPFGVISLIVYKLSAAALKTETELLSQQKLERLSQAADDFLKAMDKICVITLDRTSVRKALTIEETKINMSSDYINIMNYVTAFYQIHSYISNVEVYSELNDCVITPDGVINSKKCTFPIMKLYNETDAEKQIAVTNSNGAGYVTVTIMRKAIIGEECLGAVAVDVHINRMFDLFGIPINDSSEKLLITDEDNNIIVGSDIECTGKALADVAKVKNLTAEVQGKTYVLAQNESAIDELKYIYLSDEKLYRQANAKMVQMSFLLIFFVLMLSVLIAIYISAKTFRPLSEIISFFNKSTEIDNESDELGYITRNILTLENEKIQLTEEMQERIVMMNKAQLQALQGQMNPHFIQNTLDTIKWLVMDLEDEDSRASNMISILSGIIRYSMDMENYLVDIEKELQQTMRYVDILKIRYKDKFEIEWNVDPIVKGDKILKLSIQPLIENAMSHGIIPCRRHGKIQINVFHKNNCLVVEVKDNGAGIEKEKLDRLRKRLNSVMLLEGKQVGIYNVNLRIKIVYGDEYGVEIESNLNEGTKVVMIMGIK